MGPPTRSKVRSGAGADLLLSDYAFMSLAGQLFFHSQVRFGDLLQYSIDLALPCSPGRPFTSFSTMDSFGSLYGPPYWLLSWVTLLPKYPISDFLVNLPLKLSARW